MKNRYTNGRILKEVKTSIALKIDLTSLAPGCVGLMPVFETEEQVKKYDPSCSEVLELTVATKDTKGKS